MDELRSDESVPGDLETPPVAPLVPWETHPVAGKHGSESISSASEIVHDKNGEERDSGKRLKFSEKDDGEIEVNIPNVTRCRVTDTCNLIDTCCLIDTCDSIGAVHSSQVMTSVEPSGSAVNDCCQESELMDDCRKAFPADVARVVTENAVTFRENQSEVSPEVECPDGIESPPNLTDASDVLLHKEADAMTAEADTTRVLVTTGINPREEETAEPHRRHDSDVTTRATAAEVIDDTSHPLRSGEVVATSAEPGTAISNQNSELNQNVFQAPPFDGAKDSKNEDMLNRNFDVKETHRKSRTTDDLPTGVRSQQRRVGHLVLDELTPSNARRSARSKRKHLNSSGKHGDSRKHGDKRTAGDDDPSKSNAVAIERQRMSEVLDSVTEDASLFISTGGDWHEVNSEGESRDAIVRKSSYVRAVKVSASQIADAKVHRSTSYRIATARHQVATCGEADQPPDTGQEGDSKVDPLSRPSRSDHVTSSHVSREMPETSHSDEGVRKPRSDRRGSSSHHAEHGRRLSLAKDLLLLSPTAVSAAQSWNDAGAIALAGATDLATTPTKSSGIRRLKELFMEKSSPKDGSNVDHPHFVYEDRPEALSSSSGPVDGPLNCKNTMMDGKRSTDRAWKCVHAVLRGHHLYLHPDKATQNVLVYEHAISVKNALVDIAYDYVKRKNVFRLTTYNISEFLLEALDQESMLHWIRSIQECGYWISEKEFSASREVIRQKRLMSRQASRSAGHDSSHRKHSDSSRSPRLTSKIPEPAGLPRTRKSSREPSKSPQRENQATDEETPKSPQRKSAVAVLRHPDNSEQKSKDTRTWKSKMVKKFKRLSSQSPSSHNVEQIGAFGVELDKCIPSPNNEFVPLIVDACITIVESKGLTNKGIYRVPGNSAAIAQLQAELNKDPTSINLESEKWQDVNAVISLLKLFFRELPDPLITKELYPSMIEANRVDDQTKRMLKIKRLLHHLPMHNFETFRFLACHLNKVSSAGDINMMDARNLAIVFGPTLLQPKQDMLNMVKDMSDQCRIVESVILHCDWFFSSWDEDVNVPADGEKDSSMVPITGMDQQLIAKAEHMGKRNLQFRQLCVYLECLVLEEQTQGRKKLWRPIPSRIANPKDRGTVCVSGFLDTNNERNIDEEIVARGGQVGDKKPTTKSDGKNAKMRAKSVPPRPSSTLQVQPGKPVERMIETAPAKRKNSSPVTFQRRESAVPSGTGNARNQFHRSSSEASEKTYRVSSANAARVKQFVGASNSKPTLLEQHANNRQRKSISSHALYNAKLAQTHKLSPCSTPRGSEEKLGSPHSSRGSRSTLSGDLGDAKRKKASQLQARTDGGGRAANSKSGVGAKKLDIPSRKDGHSDSKSVGSRSPDPARSTEDENPKMEEHKNLETMKKDFRSDGDKSGEPTGIQIVEEPCLVLRQADSRRVWNSTNQRWEDLPKKRGSSTSPKRSPVKSNVENNQMSDVSSTRLNDDDDRSTPDISLNAERVSFFAEKSNVSPRLGGRQKTEDLLEIAALSLEHQVVCEDKENHIEVVFSDSPDNSVVRLSPVCQSHHKPEAGGGSPKRAPHSLSPDSLPSPGDVPSKSLAMRVVLRRNHPDFVKSEQRREPRSQPPTSSLHISPNLDHQPAEQTDSRRLTLDGSESAACELDPVSGVVDDSTSKALHRTSSEPNLRVSSPVILQLKGSPKKEMRPRPGRRSFSTFTRSQGHQPHTLPANARLRGRLQRGSSHSLTYESSV